MLPGELEARSVEAKHFDPTRRKLVPTHSTLHGVLRCDGQRQVHVDASSGRQRRREARVTAER